MNSDNDSHETAATTCKDFLAQLGPIDKLLGSVTYSDIDSGDNCKSQQQQQPIRASARVFKKMKFDQNIATSNNNTTTTTTLTTVSTTTTITNPNTDTINNCNSNTNNNNNNINSCNNNNNNNNNGNNNNNSNIGLTIDRRDDDNKQEPGTTTTTKSEIKKTVNTQWLSEEKIMFFEALNEHGKDFENIHMYMLTRLKKKGVPDELIKTKHQIRHFYYKTVSSFLRYLKISDKVPKTTQELYALINYGELWRKIGSVSKKNWPKLNELINNGSVALRIKGKTIRLKTPMCRALRRLNQLDEKYDDLKLPTRVLVELRPKNMSAFLNVQSMAQNPRIKMAISLQKRLSSLISCISARWKTTDAQIYDKAVIATNSTTNNYVPDPKTIEKNSLLLTKLLRVQPIDNATIELPSIDISEYFNGQSICLNAFEARKVVKKTKKVDNNVVKKDMITEKQHDIDNKSPIKTTTTIIDDDCNDNKITVDKVVDDAVNIILSLKRDDDDDDNNNNNNNNNNKNNDVITIGDDNDDDDDDEEDEDDDDDADDDNYDDIIIINNNNNNNNDNNNNKEEEKLKKIEEIRQGWTLENCGSLTIGELYLMFGSGSKLILEYTWDDLTTPQFKHEKRDEEIIGKSDNNLLTQSLQKLLSLAKLQYNHCVVTNNISTITATGTTITTTTIVSTVTTTMPSTTITTPTTSTCCSDGNIGKNHNHNMQFKKPITNKVIRKNQTYHDNIVIEDKCTENETQQPTPDDETFSHISNNENNDTPVVNLFTQFDIQRLNPLSRNKRRPRSKQWVVERKLVPNQSESKHQIVSMDIVPQEQKTTTTTMTETVNESTNNNNNNNNNFLELQQQQQQQSNSGLSSSGLSEILKSTGNDEQWMISNDVGDFSLSSLLGRLDYQKTNQSIASNSDTQLSTDVDAQLHTMLIETSIDYTEKFADLAAQVINNKK